MPLIDQETLGPLLRRTAASFDVPESGIADTLQRVREGDDERAARQRTALGPDPGRGASSLRRAIRSHRPLSAAAAVLVLVVAIAGVARWGLGSTPPHRSSLDSPAPAHGGAPTGLPYDTIAGTGKSSAAGTATSGATSRTFSSATAAPSSDDEGLENEALAPPVRIEETGSLNLLVAGGTFASTMAKLTALAAADGGFVSGSQTRADATSADGTVTVQVPVARFSDLLNADQGLGQASALVTKANDVTGRYVDLENRIGQLQASRQQYQDIKAELFATGSVLSVQAKLDDLGGQIDHLQDRVAALTAKTTYATLTVTLKESGS